VTALGFTDTGLTGGTTYYYQVTAVDAGGESARSAEVSATAFTTPQVTSVVVNGGAAQRSRVTTIAVAFNTAVDTALLATAFTLTSTTGATVGTVSVATATAGGRTVATLTFAGAGTEFGSLADGSWTLTIDRTRVVSAAGGVQMAADYSRAGIARKFGDGNGDGVVDFIDLSEFSTTFLIGAGQPAYNPVYDWNNDGVVDFADLSEFSGRFLT
jgi:hypothetical protein